LSRSQDASAKIHNLYFYDCSSDERAHKVGFVLCLPHSLPTTQVQLACLVPKTIHYIPPLDLIYSPRKNAFVANLLLFIIFAPKLLKTITFRKKYNFDLLNYNLILCVVFKYTMVPTLVIFS